MTYITLICAAGLSTSMLMEKMKAYAASHHLDVQIEAMPEGKFENCGRHTDILLLGPQVGYLREEDVYKRQVFYCAFFQMFCVFLRIYCFMFFRTIQFTAASSLL